MSILTNGEKIAALSPQELAELDALIKTSSINPDRLLTYPMLARPSQYAPTLMKNGIMVLQGGRGSGKTWTAAGWMIQRIIDGKCVKGGMVGKTSSDVVNVMINQQGGIKDHAQKNGLKFKINSKLKYVTVGDAEIFYYSAETPEATRGPQHDTVWLDEIGSWTDLSTKQGVGQGVLENVMFGLRTGPQPQCLITSTPARCRLFEELKKGIHGKYVTINMSTLENRANLSDGVVERLMDMYEGTPLYRQEVLGEQLDAIEGALWDFTDINYLPLTDKDHIVKTIIGVDPATTSHQKSDLTGIIVVSKLSDGTLRVMEDASCQLPSKKWAKKVIGLSEKYGATLIKVEGNQGGDMAKDILQMNGCKTRIQTIMQSRKMGKSERANVTKQLYNSGKMFHNQKFKDLEDEMFTWVPDLTRKSPDRIDALGLAAYDFLRKKHIIVGKQTAQARRKDPDGNVNDTMERKGKKQWSKQNSIASTLEAKHLLRGMKRTRRK
jgi:phage terminase large subunit-like protein